MDLKAQFKELGNQFFEEIVDVRRHLHANPELSFKEFETAKFVCRQLDAFNIEFESGVADTGIVATIKGQNPESKITALRADMDALPIDETTDLSFKSKKANIMHACGHDVHTSCAIGAAKILTSTKEHWSGTVKILFQPGEEKLPGGASLMIKAGALENPQPTSIFGQHVFPELTAGKVGFKPGIYMASCDEIYLEVIGKGGHGAMPHKCIDPIAISAQLISSLQQVVSRKANPSTPSVLTFGKIVGLGATNVIPNSVSLEGTFRTFSESWRAEAHAEIERICDQVCKAYGATCVLRIEKGYPFLHNDESLSFKAIEAAKHFVGEDNVVDLEARMTAEDFAYYSQQMPSCFYRLGTSSENGSNAFPVHNSNFSVDEESMKVGMSLMAYLATT